MFAAFNACMSAFNALSAVVAAVSRVSDSRWNKKKRGRVNGEKEITNGRPGRLSAGEMNYKSCVRDPAVSRRTDQETRF